LVTSCLRSARRSQKKSKKRIAYLEALAKLIDEPSPQGVFVCCFCVDENLLSQWRSYGANGTGVCLERFAFNLMRIRQP
ncbi:MAG TPA: hypothetical protein VLL72_06110, partial [Kiloniellales bacterium]|nr:hypothetical protein [Kiloniellales bacterium]